MLRCAELTVDLVCFVAMHHIVDLDPAKVSVVRGRSEGRWKGREEGKVGGERGREGGRGEREGGWGARVGGEGGRSEVRE